MNKKDCDSGCVCDVQFCDENMQTCSNHVKSIENRSEILKTDQILFTRPADKGTELYRASLEELSPELSLSLLQKATLHMSRTDPGDGYSLWIDDGVIRLASGDPSRLGVISPHALEQSLKEIFALLPHHDPGDGGLWVSGGMLMQGSNFKRTI